MKRSCLAIFLVLVMILTPTNAMAETRYVDSDKVAMALIGAGLVVGSLIWWMIHSARKNKKAKGKITLTHWDTKPTLNLLLDLQDDRTGSPLVFEKFTPSLRVGVTIRF